MDQPKRRTPKVNSGGFILAAILAPGMALAIWILGTGLGLAGLSSEPDGIGTILGGLPALLLAVSLWGALPSLIFGGLALAAIQRLPRPERPTDLSFMMGGVGAAGLYVLTGLGIAGLSPMATMVFAPWAPPLKEGAANWWLVASLLLAGAGAGRIYAAFAKRG